MTLLYVLPYHSQSNALDVSRANPKLSSQLSASQVRSRPNIADILFRQLNHWMCFTVWLTTLGGTISHVIQMRPEKKMIGTDTQRRIAMMADKHVLRDRTIGDRVRINMGSYRTIVDRERTIAARANPCGPKPTRSALVNFFPEACRGGFNPCSISTVFRAIYSEPFSDLGLGCLKVLTTTNTCAGDFGRLGVHWTLLSSGATPLAVTSSAGVFRCSNYTKTRVSMRKLEAVV